MRLHLIAVGTRMPAWVDTAVADYLRRLRASTRVDLTEIATAGRGSDAKALRARLDEGRRMLAALGAHDHVIALDEHGSEWSTLELARWLEQRRQAGQNLAFLIGGPDGFAPDILNRAQQRWSLSRLTLPHALVRVLLAEQLYRASSVLAGHPYHRS